MSLLRSYIKRLILEEVESPSGWNFAEDSDFPAPDKSLNKAASKLRTKYGLVLDPEDLYMPEGNTHGGISHAIKHGHEFNPEITAKATFNALKIFYRWYKKNPIQLYKQKRHANNSPRTNLTPINIAEVGKNPGLLLNYIDQISDNIINGKTISDLDRAMYKEFAPVIQAYNQYINNIVSNATDVSDQNFPNALELYNFLKKEPIIYFKASFKGKPASGRFVDLANGDFVGLSAGKFSTAFNPDRNSKNKQNLWSRILKYAPEHKRENRKTGQIDTRISTTQITPEYSNLILVAQKAMDKKLFWPKEERTGKTKTTGIDIPETFPEDIVKTSAKQSEEELQKTIDKWKDYAIQK
tara:strand:+ start:1955 stop:3016 length:1062 start_codon:yes stop_codon:yes gene_type:complete